MRQVIEFAYENNLVLLADEVYQENVYCKRPWQSFKKLVKNSSKRIQDNVELISFHSASKGDFGECGVRGGYFELTNIDEQFQGFLRTQYQFVDVNITGQVITTLKARFLSGELRHDIGKENFELIQKEQSKIH